MSSLLWVYVTGVCAWLAFLIAAFARKEDQLQRILGVAFGVLLYVAAISCFVAFFFNVAADRGNPQVVQNQWFPLLVMGLSPFVCYWLAGVIRYSRR